MNVIDGFGGGVVGGVIMVLGRQSDLNGCGKVVVQRRFEMEDRGEPALHWTAVSEAVRWSGPTFARANPSKNLLARASLRVHLS